jgi:archaellum biogenesis protein FlaJ (TadC family)
LSLDPDLEREAIAAAEEALAPADAEGERSVRRQMDTLYARDRWMAIAMVVALIVVLPFVYIALWDNMPSAATKVVLAVSGAVLLIYNVASMVALVRNYRRDKDFIYRRDVAHLRELRVARRGARERS